MSINKDITKMKQYVFTEWSSPLDIIKYNPIEPIFYKDKGLYHREFQNAVQP